jgi:hypothetical protein
VTYFIHGINNGLIIQSGIIWLLNITSEVATLGVCNKMRMKLPKRNCEWQGDETILENIAFTKIFNIMLYFCCDFINV